MSTISKKRFDSLIPLAIDVINDMKAEFIIGSTDLVFTASDGTKEKRTVRAVPNAFHGYFSSFGADMINSTPLAAIIFFEEADKASGGRSKENKALIPRSILNLIKKENPNDREVWPTELSKYYCPDDKSCIVKIAAAAAALKIALRTFPKS
ncbi:MAG: hypothetical protein IPM92_02685 [Saprospiraceae bacterium]|nr:hypothetical protein [Saprospiraceae bacterium]